MLGANPVVSSQQPSIQVPKDDVNHWKVLVRVGVITLDQHYLVHVAQLFQIVIAGRSVCSHFSARPYILQNKRFERLLFAIWEYLET